MNRDELRILERLRREIESKCTPSRTKRVTPEVTAKEIRRHLQSSYDFERPLEPDQLFDDTTRMLRDWTVDVTHPRYFGLFNPSVTNGSIVGDTLAAIYNPQLAAWSHAPAANEIERHVLRYLAGMIGFDPDAIHANFATGGAEANLSAVLVALSRRFPQFVRDGIGIAKPVIYVSDESHHSFIKIAAMTGIGVSAIRTLPVTEDLRMDTAALWRAITEDRQAGRTPLLVDATAGTTSAGVIDPLAEIADICQAEDLWFHVDAAWGGSYLFVPELIDAFVGIERADSVTWDAHKGLSVPMGAGMFFCRHREAVPRAFDVRTAYMPTREEGTEDPYSTTVQWTRRAIGMKVFYSLASLGRSGYEAMLRRQTALGHGLRRRLEAQSWLIVNHTPLPIVCFTKPGYSGERLTKIASNVQRNGDAWISATTLGESRPALRACITSFLTEESDLDALLEELATAETE